MRSGAPTRDKLCRTRIKRSKTGGLRARWHLELDWLAGKIVALGREYGIPTPAQEAVYAILKPYRMGRLT